MVTSSSSEPRQLPTNTLYNTWAETYDTDGNILQLLDSAAFAARVPGLLTTPQRILDLGCGTGRNTQQLAALLPAGSTVHAIDASEGMLAVARARLAGHGVHGGGDIHWHVCDLAHVEGALGGRVVDGVVSTLVLEHVRELDVFFAAVAGVLAGGGWAWVTDMHPEMDGSRAGFRGGDGVKVVGESWNHGIAETVAAAERAGLGLVGEVDVRGVGDEDEARALGVRARKWVGKKMLIGMLFRRKERGGEDES